MNNRYIAIFVALIVIVAAIVYFTYPGKEVPPVVAPIETPVEEATSTPEVAPVATTTPTATTTKPTPTVTPKPTPTPTPTPAPVVTTPTTKAYTLAEISTHNSKASCWTAIYEKAYDITTYIPRHPGGESQIMKVCGKDGTYLFVDQHDSDKKPNAKLASFMIGDLVK